jgi:hypothetical protein
LHGCRELTEVQIESIPNLVTSTTGSVRAVRFGLPERCQRTGHFFRESMTRKVFLILILVQSGCEIKRNCMVGLGHSRPEDTVTSFFAGDDFTEVSSKERKHDELRRRVVVVVVVVVVGVVLSSSSSSLLLSLLSLLLSLLALLALLSLSLLLLLLLLPSWREKKPSAQIARGWCHSMPQGGGGIGHMPSTFLWKWHVHGID